MNWLTLNYQNFDGRGSATRKRSKEAAFEPVSLPQLIGKSFVGGIRFLKSLGFRSSFSGSSVLF